MNKKNIRSNFVKDSLLEYDSLAKTLKENTSSIVKDLLNESVKETYQQILSESEKDEDAYDVDGVEEVKDAPIEDGAEEEVPEEPEEQEEGETLESAEADDADAEGEDWSSFDKYKVSDDEYDFSNAEDEDVVKVYKLLKDDDQVLVKVDNNKVEIKDNETGAEYIVDLGSEEEPLEEDEPMEMADDDLEDTQENQMEESRIYEVALNEYDVIDNYQKTDVMTNGGMEEPGNGRDIDKGLPSNKTAKPWPGSKKAEAPFNGKQGKKVEESIELEMDDSLDADSFGEGEIEEGTLTTSRWNGNHSNKHRKPAALSDEYQRDGLKKYSDGAEYHAVKEARMISQVNKIMKENKALKSALSQFKATLEEAAVTNYNLGQIVKLFSENSTTMDEKKEIISRFGKEATTLSEAKKLYKTLNEDLKKKNKMNINEDRQFSTVGSKMINETKIYQSDDVLNTLDLMSRICK